MLYNYTKYKDVYTIENLDTQNLKVNIYLVDCDSVNLYKKDILILPGKKLILPITKIDAIFRVKIETLIETITLPDIYQFNNTLIEFIIGVNKILCGCKPCNECEECDKCEEILNTLNLGLSYFHINTPKFNTYLDEISKFLKCFYTQEIFNLNICNITTGNNNTENLLKLNIAALYLTFYLIELEEALDLEESEHIKNKYMSSQILKCIKKLGININNFEIFEDMKVYYWQLEDINKTFNDVQEEYTNVYLNDKPFTSFEEFTQGRIVHYSNIGRICFAIRETNEVNYNIEDSLGRDITDDFQSFYNLSDKTKVFVSNIPYSYSNIYFKFKKITYLP